jgi:hypothetical protein
MTDRVPLVAEFLNKREFADSHQLASALAERWPDLSIEELRRAVVMAREMGAANAREPEAEFARAMGDLRAFAADLRREAAGDALRRLPEAPHDERDNDEPG